MRASPDSHAALRRALLTDAAATAGMGVLLLAAAGLLEGLLGLPAGLLRWAGLVLVPFGALLAFHGLRGRVSARAGWMIVGCNLLWAADSLLLLASGWVEPTALGVAFVAGQGAVVAAFAWMEWAGLMKCVSAKCVSA